MYCEVAMSHNPPSEFQLSQSSRDWLLQLARNTIRDHLTHSAAEPRTGTPPSECEQKAGCFVTLHSAQNELRGCIGTFDQTTAVWQNVKKMAIHAATRDPRFAPLSAPELDSCTIEISALTPLIACNASDVLIGRDGLEIEAGHARGVLLPQVATEHGWDRETFLAQTCRKAGLPPDAWRQPDTKIWRFEAVVFTE